MEIAHTLEFIKRQAKNIKKLNNITHMQALEISAQRSGYKDWAEAVKFLKPKI